MRTDFSKPSGDIAKECSLQLQENKELLDRQNRISSALSSCSNRLHCVVCHAALEKPILFKHRLTDYVKCLVCDHVQTQKLPEQGYPTHIDDGVPFNQVYSRLSPEEYASRKKRIYQPKLDWLLDCSQELGMERQEIINLKWFEFGCGAGYFLSSLSDVGAQNISGVEDNRALVEIANEALSGQVVKRSDKPLTEVVSENKANIYVAFFVLEHVEDTKEFFEMLGCCPKGTAFFFSVPTFGFSTMLENCSESYFSRNLDSVLHTQLFTDSSIKYCLEHAGYEMKAQWVFGQDSDTLYRMIMVALSKKYPKALLKEVEKDILKLNDPIQHVIDKHYLADARHILAVKK